MGAATHDGLEGSHTTNVIDIDEDFASNNANQKSSQRKDSPNSIRPHRALSETLDAAQPVVEERKSIQRVAVRSGGQPFRYAITTAAS